MAYRPLIPSANSVDGLARQIYNELLRFSGEVEKGELQEFHAAPKKPFHLMMVFADGSDWNPGKGRGVYFYDAGDGGWHMLVSGIGESLHLVGRTVLQKSATQTLPTNVVTNIDWDVVVEDPLGALTSSNTITVPAGIRYARASVAINYANSTDGAERLLHTPAIGLGRGMITVLATPDCRIGCRSALQAVNPGVSGQFTTRQKSGGDLNILNNDDTWAIIEWYV